MLTRVHEWIVEHDESRTFIVLYIGLAVVLSIWLGLFWLCVVVGVHAVFEAIKQHHRDPRPGGVLARALWELKLDVALILFAFVITLYMDVVLGVAGIGAAARAGVQGSTRFVVWQKVLRGILLSVDDVAQVARAVAARSVTANGTIAEVETSEVHGHQTPGAQSVWGGSWSRGDRLTLGFGLLCGALVLVAPWLTGRGVEPVLTTLIAELRPFPSSSS